VSDTAATRTSVNNAKPNATFVAVVNFFVMVRSFVGITDFFLLVIGQQPFAYG
jgi:hypothetical protein